MKTVDLDIIVDQTVQAIRELLVIKGGEYAGSEDRLANFKRGASRVGLHPMQVLWIYAAKHIDSIETYIKDQAAATERARSEPIEGRLDDLINYCILLKGLIHEAKSSSVDGRDISVGGDRLRTGPAATDGSV